MKMTFEYPSSIMSIVVVFVWKITITSAISAYHH